MRREFRYPWLANPDLPPKAQGRLRYPSCW